MRLGKHVILWAYRSELRWYSQAGVEHESDPDCFCVWLYLGLFGIALSWCRDGWIKPPEADSKRALALLNAAPDPQLQTPAFLDEWDRLEGTR